MLDAKMNVTLNGKEDPVFLQCNGRIVFCVEIFQNNSQVQ